MARRHPSALTILTVILVVALGAAFRLSPLWPGPGLPTGATRLALATESAHLIPAFGCLGALLPPGRVAVDGDELVLVSEEGGERLDVVWPSGWAAWRREGRAELVDRNGALIGREGDVVEGFGGGPGIDEAFHVCIPFS